MVSPRWVRAMVAGLADHDAVGGAMDLSTLANGVAPPVDHPLMNGLDEWQGFLPFV